MKHYFSALQLLVHLLFKTKKNEKLIVYHSLALNLPIKIAKLIKNLNIVLEVEEIYSDVWVGNTDNGSELKYIKSFDKFIFASDYLKEKISDINNVVVYGSYQSIDTEITKKKTNNEINIVYAGSIDTTKGGAKNAVTCMEYLPQNYRLHILGFGEESEVQNLIDSINRMNTIKGYKSCEFHGTLVGKNYEEFLLSCDIGLNPQFEGEYMNTAFPSKILSYLSHGLMVVSTSITSIKKSKISKYITFSVDDKPESIAKAILSIDTSKSMSSQDIINNLDKEFLRNLELLLSTK
ncbi:glycosyltransferase [Senegalia massiliensis]|uniref:Glycosyltransferase n=2 Tax=Senegalia massiliensis TaxID=1720316 RepID=A0A845QYL1_9CLOT|nr:glycosyltransferase [Senegalia massiliensis]